MCRWSNTTLDLFLPYVILLIFLREKWRLQNCAAKFVEKRTALTIMGVYVAVVKGDRVKKNQPSELIHTHNRTRAGISSSFNNDPSNEGCTLVQKDFNKMIGSIEFNGFSDLETEVESIIIACKYFLDWEPKTIASSGLFKNVWCRCASVYFDWASHVRELKELSEQDQEILLVGRCITSVWLMMGYKSAERNFNGVVFSGGVYYPGDASEMKRIDKDMLMICKDPIRVFVDDFIKPAIKLKITEAEYTLLRVICLLSPVPGLSQNAIQKLQKAKEKYINALSEIVQKCNPHLNVLEALNKISNLIMLISVAEKVAEMEDNNMSLMSMFNIAQIRGTLPYDIHVRRYSPNINHVIKK